MEKLITKNGLYLFGTVKEVRKQLEILCKSYSLVEEVVNLHIH